MNFYYWCTLKLQLTIYKLAVIAFHKIKLALLFLKKKKKSHINFTKLD